MRAYFDCTFGASGDMVLGALIDAGVEVEYLRAELQKLGVDGYTLSAEKVVRQGISGTQVRVELEEHHQSQVQHDHERHSEQHEHESGERHHSHQHSRGLNEVLRLIAASGLSERVKRDSSEVFRRLADAEGQVHGIAPSEVHFHEVGAVDAIVDIVGSCLGLEKLGIDTVYASSMPTGSGTVRCTHGLLAVPAPATLELFRACQIPTWSGPGAGELVTPTGAAIIGSLATFRQPRLHLQRVGYGFGQTEFSWPNVLRLWLGTSMDDHLGKESTLVMLETNIDDSPGELLGAAMERLFAAGALDVYFTPIQMKKNRPAVQLSVIAPRQREVELAQVILRETSSLGLRVREVSCWQARYETRMAGTPWGEVRAKVKRWGDQAQVYPEYEDCLRLARENGLSLSEIYEYVRCTAAAQLE